MAGCHSFIHSPAMFRIAKRALWSDQGRYFSDNRMDGRVFRSKPCQSSTKAKPLIEIWRAVPACRLGRRGTNGLEQRQRQRTPPRSVDNDVGWKRLDLACFVLKTNCGDPVSFRRGMNSVARQRVRNLTWGTRSRARRTVKSMSGREAQKLSWTRSHCGNGS
jgi:hypothetical protein